MVLLRWPLLLLAVSCFGQTLQLGDVVFLGSQAYPEPAAVDIGPGGVRLLAGNARQAGLPIVQGSGRVFAANECRNGGPPNPCPDVYAAVFENDGRVRFATYLGGLNPDSAIDAAFAPNGDVWLLATSSSADYPLDIDFADGAVRGVDTFLTRLSGNSGVVISSTRLPAGLQGTAFDIGPDGSLFVAGSAPPGVEEVGGLGLDFGAANYFRSDDAGATWSTANRGLDAVPSDTQAWPDGHGGTLLVANGGREVVLSRDRGENWERFESPDGLPVVSVGAVNADPPRLLVATHLGVFSRDVDGPKGEGWHESLSGPVEWLATAPSDPSIVYAWGDMGVSRSSDGGVSFEPTQWTTGVDSSGPGGITVDPTDANTVYLSSMDFEVPVPLLIRSVDGGQSWIEMPIEIPEDPPIPGPFSWPLSVAFGPGPAPAIYVALNGGLLRSLDGGVTWRAIDSGIRERIMQSGDARLIVSGVHVSGTTIYAVTFAGMFRSADGGETWERFATNVPFELRRSTLAVDPVEPDTVYLSGLGGAENAFVLKTDPNATAIEYLAVLGGAGPESVRELNVDSFGRAWVTGDTASVDFPVTGGAPVPVYSGNESDAFVAALSPTGASLEFATFAGGTGKDSTAAATLDDEGRLWTIQRIQRLEDGGYFGGFVAQLSSYTVTQSTEAPLEFPTGFSIGGGNSNMEVDADGRTWILLGGTCDPRFCGPRESYLQVVDGAGAILASATLNEAFALTLDATGDAWVGGRGELGVTPLKPPRLEREVGYLAKLSLAEPADGPRLAAIVQSAGFLGRPLVAGAIVSLFGEALGPAEGTSFEIRDGFVESAPGARVFFDEEEAAVLFAQSGQVNAITPSAAAGKSSVNVRVETVDGNSNTFRLATAEACPAIFHLDESGRAAALNQDGSINSAQNPAPPGSVVALFVTALGGYQPAVEPDRVALSDPPLPLAALPLQAFLGNDPVSIAYAGVAPGLIAAGSQVNLPIPPNATPGEKTIRLEAAGCSGAPAIIGVQ